MDVDSSYSLNDLEVFLLNPKGCLWTLVSSHKALVPNSCLKFLSGLKYP